MNAMNMRETKLNKAQGPPPPLPGGNLPGVRLQSEIGPRSEPPACVQNAMMTKDKKPFTYTPGGIDLSEIRSPRMARRIERNANAPGVGDVPKSPNNFPHQTGPLPPAALAAMQSNLPVQVFPSGAPPPPPPQPHAPPPPPPMQALPTRPVSTKDGIIERPDMSKIIPENPMALLRKTPRVEPKSFMDELNNEPTNQQQLRHIPPAPPTRIESHSPQFNRVEPPRYEPNEYQNNYAPPKPQMAQQPEPPRPQPPSQMKTSTAQIGSLYIPAINNQPEQQPRRVITPPTPPQRQSPQSPQSPMAKLNQAPRPWQNQKKQEPEKPQWAQRNSPPHESSQMQSPQYQAQSPQYQVQSPQYQAQSPQYQVQSPQYQAQSPQYQPNRATQPPEDYYQPQPNRMQTRVIPVQMQPPAPKPGVDVVWVTQPEVFQHPGDAPNQRWVPPQAQKQPQTQRVMTDAQGARIIPIQIEGANVQNMYTSSGAQTPSTPNNGNNNYNRQQSWTPTQSNSFKMIQKITNTDGDAEEEDGVAYSEQPTIEHGPRTSQQFPQTTEQVRKMNLTDGDRDLMNKFKQEIYIKYDEENPRYRGGHIPSRVFRFLDESGVDENHYLHNEVDPRYRGAVIPSKAFRLLQSMTGGNNPHAPSAVPQAAPQGARAPQVRNIPVHIEGNDQPQAYVHPSEQTVPEPKKYMGSAIPSRSFKRLQAMTPLADGNQTNENYDPSSCEQWGYPQQPYWHDYYSYYYPQYPQSQNTLQESSDSDNAKHTNPRTTPVPQQWNYYQQQPNYPPNQQQTQCSPIQQTTTNKSDCESDSEQNRETKVCTSCRNTPVHFWNNYYNPNPYYQGYETPTSEMEQSETEASQRNTPASFDYQQYPQQPSPYWDPYYYNYYGYPPPMYPPPPPMYPQYPPYYPSDCDGYSSNEEMAFYGNQFNPKPQVATPSITVTPIIPEDVKAFEEIRDDQSECTVVEDRDADSESDQDEEVGEIYRRSTSSILSLHATEATKEHEEEQLIQESDVEYEDDYDNEGDVSEASTEDNDEEGSVYVVEDAIPHVLSVIFEENERSLSSRMDVRSSRESSIATTISDETIVLDEDEEDFESEQEIVSVKLPLTLTFCVSKDNKEVAQITVGNSEVRSFNWNPDDAPKNTFANPSQTPTKDFDEISEADPSNITEATATYESNEESEISMENEEVEVDFWSQIQPEEEIIPRRNKSNKYSEYRNSMYSSEQSDDTEIIKSEEALGNCTSECKESENMICVEETTNKESHKELTLKNENCFESEIENVKETKLVTTYECESEDEIITGVGVTENKQKHQIISKKIKDIENIVDIVSNEKIERKMSIGIKANEQSIEKVTVEDFKISNLVFERAQIKETLRPPTFDLGLQDFFKSFQTNLVYVEDTPKEINLNKKQPIQLLDDSFKFGEDFEPFVVNNNQMQKDLDIEQEIVDEIIQTGRLKESDLELNINCGKTEEVEVGEEEMQMSIANAQEVCNDEIFIKGSDEERNYELQINCSKTEEVEVDEEFEIQMDIMNAEEAKLEICNDEIIEELKLENDNKKQLIDNCSKFDESKDESLDESDTSSTSSSNSSSSSSSSVSEKESPINEEILQDITDEDKEVNDANNNMDQQQMQVPTIKDRIRALQNASRNSNKKRIRPEAEEEPSKVDCLLPTSGSKSRSLSTKSSVDYNSEDDIDSGVTSDISRHISDTESEFTELRKMSRYQRAATHSRLFKLLQDECDEEDELENEEFKKLNASITRKNAALKEEERLIKEKHNQDMIIRRESLSLPLRNNLSDYESFSSSGINSPASPVSDKLVNELVLSLLRKKKGQLFRGIPMQKLQAAAYKILQEDRECTDLSSSEEFTSYLSPLRTDTEYSTPAQTPQYFYNNSEYNQYYESFAPNNIDEFDILPSKTFKLIQEHSVSNKAGTISGFAAKCPRVLSLKNVHSQAFSEFVDDDDDDCESPVIPENNSLQTQEASSAS